MLTDDVRRGVGRGGHALYRGQLTMMMMMMTMSPYIQYHALISDLFTPNTKSDLIWLWILSTFPHKVPRRRERSNVYESQIWEWSLSWSTLY